MIDPSPARLRQAAAVVDVVTGSSYDSVQRCRRASKGHNSRVSLFVPYVLPVLKLDVNAMPPARVHKEVNEAFVLFRLSKASLAHDLLSPFSKSPNLRFMKPIIGEAFKLNAGPRLHFKRHRFDWISETITLRFLCRITDCTESYIYMLQSLENRTARDIDPPPELLTCPARRAK